MKLGRLVFASIVSLGATSALAASNSANDFRVYGYGAASCTDFVTEATKDQNVLLAYFSWAQGYMSRMNGAMKQAKGKDVDLHPKTFDANKQVAALGDFCANNAQSHFVDAVEALYEYLDSLSATTS